MEFNVSSTALGKPRERDRQTDRWERDDREMTEREKEMTKRWPSERERWPRERDLWPRDDRERERGREREKEMTEREGGGVRDTHRGRERERWPRKRNDREREWDSQRATKNQWRSLTFSSHSIVLGSKWINWKTCLVQPTEEVKKIKPKIEGFGLSCPAGFNHACATNFFFFFLVLSRCTAWQTWQSVHGVNRTHVITFPQT